MVTKLIHCLLGIFIGILFFSGVVKGTVDSHTKRESLYDVYMAKEERVHNETNRVCDEYVYIQNNNTTVYQNLSDMTGYRPTDVSVILVALIWDNYPDLTARSYSIKDGYFYVECAEQGKGIPSKIVRVDGDFNVGEVEDGDATGSTFSLWKNLMSDSKDETYQLIIAGHEAMVKEIGVAELLDLNGIKRKSLTKEEQVIKDEQDRVAAEKKRAEEEARRHSIWAEQIYAITDGLTIDDVEIDVAFGFLEMILRDILLADAKCNIWTMKLDGELGDIEVLVDTKDGANNVYREYYFNKDFTPNEYVYGEYTYVYTFREQANRFMKESIAYSEHAAKMWRIEYKFDEYEAIIKENRSKYYE